MKSILLTTIFLPTILFSKRDRIDDYLHFLDSQQAYIHTIGNYKEGEIEIVKDQKKIKEIEEIQRIRFKNQGMSDQEALESSRIGIITKDSYWVWVRDAVIFPTGAVGSYNRLIWTSSLEDGTPGIAVMPILPDGRIVLNVNFRHATRHWELEIPRGFKKEGESVENAVKRELQEETGLEVASQTFLGLFTPDSGTLAAQVPVYVGTVKKKGISNQDYSEAILFHEAFTLHELKEALAVGWVEMDLKGKKEKVGIRDSFLVYAILQAEHKKIL